MADQRYTSEDFGQILRVQETVPPGDWEHIIVAALRIASRVAREGVIEDALRAAMLVAGGMIYSFDVDIIRSALMDEGAGDD